MYVLHAIITTVKAYIYSKRVAEKTDLSIAKVKDLLELEKHSFKVNGNLNKFYDRWKMLNSIHREVQGVPKVR